MISLSVCKSENDVRQQTASNEYLSRYLMQVAIGDLGNETVIQSFSIAVHIIEFEASPVNRNSHLSAMVPSETYTITCLSRQW